MCSVPSGSSRATDAGRQRPRPASGPLAAGAAVAIACTAALSALQPVTLAPVGGIPIHVAGQFEEPLGFQQAASGTYYVFDRRAHAVYAIDRQRREATRLITVGPEHGRLLGPTAIDVGPGGIIAVADGPNLVERIQFFNERGERIGGFTLPGRAAPRVTFGTMVLSGVSSLQFTGRSVLLNQPETGGLVTEYGLAGTPLRTFGQLRATGHEEDRDLHLALNVGLPIVNPRGGYYFVFLSGEPRYRKYDPSGQLVYERLIQGREIDSFVANRPTEWPRRAMGGQVLPLVPPTIRTAAADPQGRLWVSFVLPYTYIFDEDGDKVGSVQFEAAGILAPNSLSFPGGSRVLVTPGLYEFRIDE
jgi:hypothetical protein